MLMRHPTQNAIAPFELWESGVRSYCRAMPAVFQRALAAEIWDESGNRYIDFWSACGSLNYGHNHPKLKAAVIEYLTGDGVINSLDLHTCAKRAFIETFAVSILMPRGFDYVLQFTGPTGTNAVEAAIKLARKIKGRPDVVAFTNAFHGMSLGSLALTGNRNARMSSAALLNHVVRLPYDGYDGAGITELERFATMVRDPSAGLPQPAAIIVETVQGEGGLNVASTLWLQCLARIARQLDALLIVDEVQTGCGRTGPFFSFERAGIQPDMVCLAKSLSGFGLPMSLVLIKREHDVWEPGEHNGTFRGNNLAFITATAALNLWTGNKLMPAAIGLHRRVDDWCEAMTAKYPARSKGLGAMRGLAFDDERIASAIAQEAYSRGILLECCGPNDEVLKLMPPLNIEDNVLDEGLEKLEAAVTAVMERGTHNSVRKKRGSGLGKVNAPALCQI